MLFSPENQQWLAAFHAKHGRAPRILHIGNIANNAYNNAKLLNEAGLDCDVICYDYYHIMGCPEWEEADFNNDGLDHFAPDWIAAGVTDFERPRWFAQGPMQACIDYLLAKRENLTEVAQQQWEKLGELNRTRIPPEKSTTERRFTRLMNRSKNVLRFLAYTPDIARRIIDICESGRISKWLPGETARLGAATALLIATLFIRIVAKTFVFLKRKTIGRKLDRRIAELARKFNTAYPDRTDKLTASDFESYLNTAPKWRRLFGHYDLVHAYATDPILPLICNHPYVAFEHGTIRNIPFEATTQGRLCALSYRLADWVVITNADNMESARRLGIPHFTFVPHPINEDGTEESNASHKLRGELQASLDADFLVFHPARQHWSSERHPDWEKGNDLLLKGFARFVAEVNHRAALILVNWGASVENSRKLIAELGIESRVCWVAPMPHRRMIEYIQACDVVADQFYLGAFGSTLPKAFVCNRAAMIYLDAEIHRECFPEMPPVANVRSEQDIFEGLSLLDKESSRFGQQGYRWYDQYHSNRIIADRLIGIYASVLDANNA